MPSNPWHSFACKPPTDRLPVHVCMQTQSFNPFLFPCIDVTSDLQRLCRDLRNLRTRFAQSVYAQPPAGHNSRLQTASSPRAEAGCDWVGVMRRCCRTLVLTDTCCVIGGPNIHAEHDGHHLKCWISRTDKHSSNAESCTSHNLCGGVSSRCSQSG